MKSNEICVVLVQTKDDINIGNAVRACKNFGVFDLRLVNPRSADPEKIKISAPRSGSFIASIRTFSSLEDALADRDLVIGMSARERYATREILSPRGAAQEAYSALEGRPKRTAFVFGREDRGLTNEECDTCDLLVTIPTNPDYSSLNLGQAVLLQMWECFQVGNEGGKKILSHTIEGDRSTSVEKKRMGAFFSQVDRSLKSIGFYKYGDGTHVMRGLKILYNRSRMSEREFALMFGIFSEVEKQTERLRKKRKAD